MPWRPFLAAYALRTPDGTCARHRIGWSDRKSLINKLPRNFAEDPEVGLLMPPETSTVRGDQSVEDLRRELAEAREQQAATAEILTAISNSPTDPYRVFADIATSAARLCDAYDSTIHPAEPVGPIPFDSNS
jgi:hypothetical protein